MTRTEFIAELRAMADDLECGNFHITDIGKNKIFCNKNYGQVWVKLSEECSVNVDLYSATDEERKIND